MNALYNFSVPSTIREQLWEYLPPSLSPRHAHTRTQTSTQAHADILQRARVKSHDTRMRWVSMQHVRRVEKCEGGGSLKP
jgi:hypothetical protein